MKPYQPSNKVTINGLTLMLLSSIIGGVVIGGVVYLLSLLIYLIVLFPLGIGLAGAGVMSITIGQGKVRNPKIAAFFGLLTGLIIYGSIHSAEYWEFKRVASKEISSNLTQVSEDQNNPIIINQIIDNFLQEETGAQGFWGYLKYSAQQGVSIGRLGREGFNLGEMATWIYWLIELSAIEIMIAAAAYSNAKKPFCEKCDRWYEHKKRVGNVEPQFSDNFLNLLQRDRFREAGKLVNAFKLAKTSSLEVHLQCCPSCQLSDVVLDVNITSLDDKGHLKLNAVTQGMLSIRQYHRFHEGIESR